MPDKLSVILAMLVWICVFLYVIERTLLDMLKVLRKIDLKTWPIHQAFLREVLLTNQRPRLVVLPPGGNPIDPRRWIRGEMASTSR